MEDVISTVDKSPGSFRISNTQHSVCEGLPEDMQAKQLNEIAAMVEVGAKISNVKFVKAKKDDKDGWNLQFDYQSREGMQTCMLISQRNELRFWSNLNSAVKEVLNLFPDITEVGLCIR